MRCHHTAVPIASKSCESVPRMAVDSLPAINHGGFEIRKTRQNGTAACVAYFAIDPEGLNAVRKSSLHFGNRQRKVEGAVVLPDVDAFGQQYFTATCDGKTNREI